MEGELEVSISHNCQCLCPPWTIFDFPLKTNTIYHSRSRDKAVKKTKFLTSKKLYSIPKTIFLDKYMFKAYYFRKR